jgi:hypothetical protein
MTKKINYGKPPLYNRPLIDEKLIQIENKLAFLLREVTLLRKSMYYRSQPYSQKDVKTFDPHGRGGGGGRRKKKYKSCTAGIGHFCKKHQCVHREEESK